MQWPFCILQNVLFQFSLQPAMLSPSSLLWALCDVQVKVTILQPLQEQVLLAVPLSLEGCSNLPAQMHGPGAL